MVEPLLWYWVEFSNLKKMRSWPKERRPSTKNSTKWGILWAKHLKVNRIHTEIHIRSIWKRRLQGKISSWQLVLAFHLRIHRFQDSSMQITTSWEEELTLAFQIQTQRPLQSFWSQSLSWPTSPIPSATSHPWASAPRTRPWPTSVQLPQPQVKPRMTISLSLIPISSCNIPATPPYLPCPTVTL